MSTSGFVIPAITFTGNTVIFYVLIRYGPDSLLRLIAAATAILAAGSTPRSERALKVLSALGNRSEKQDDDPPDGTGSP